MRMYRERADGARISKGWGVGVRVSDRADAGPGVYRDGVRGRDSGGRGRERDRREIGEIGRTLELSFVFILFF